MPLACVSCVVFDAQGSVLLIERAKEPNAGLLSLPGGRIEPGESAELACERELREETGLVGKCGPVVDVISASANGRDFVITVFAVKLLGGLLCAASDARSAGFFSLSELPKLATTDGLLQVVQKAWLLYLSGMVQMLDPEA